MTCLVTANPSERLYWTRDGIEMVDSPKYQTHVWRVGHYSNTLGAFIRDLSASDYGDYRCIAKNQFGQADEKITIHGTLVSYVMSMYLLLHAIVMHVTPCDCYACYSMRLL